MRYTATLFAALVLAGLLWTPQRIDAQSGKEFVALQREFYETNAKIDELKKAQDERVGQMEALIKQLVESNGKLAEQLRSLQDKATESATQQDRRVIAPLDDVKKNVADLWQQFSTTQGSLDTIKGRLDRMDKGLTDVTGTLGLMREDLSKVSAPPAPTSAAPGPADAVLTAYMAAEKDYLAGKLDVALRELLDLANAYPTAPEAPMAIYKTGVIYADYPQPQDAIKAFDRVLEQFGDNPYRKAAQFGKAEQLAALGKNAEAAREFNNYAKQYPDDENASVAKQRATELTSPGAAKPKATPPRNRRGK
jgi:TolA-binding protein